jgi:hypothetical protein
MMDKLSNQSEEDGRSDVADLTEVVELAKMQTKALGRIEFRHRTNASGVSMAAMACAQSDERALIVDVQRIAAYLGLLDKMGGAVS